MLHLSKNIKKTEFSADEFVKYLLKEGGKTNCDDSVSLFSRYEELPPYFDENLFRKAQKFYRENIFAIFGGKLFGLLAILLVPSILRILMLTKRSSTNLTAYRRYLATVFHVCVWYDSDFKSGSKLWKSIAEVKRKHNSASKKGRNSGINSISQQDMAITQFGFMGFAVCRTKYIGLHNATFEDLHALVHMWRVIGYVLGIEDRFNICRDSLKETTEICEVLIKKVLQPRLAEKNNDFLEMTSYLTNGLWCMMPLLNHKVVLNFLDKMLQNQNFRSNDESCFLSMTTLEKWRYNFFNLVLHVSLKYNFFRYYHNASHRLSLWLMQVFPFLAYYQFGKSNSHVYILK